MASKKETGAVKKMVTNHKEETQHFESKFRRASKTGDSLVLTIPMEVIKEFNLTDSMGIQFTFTRKGQETEYDICFVEMSNV